MMRSMRRPLLVTFLLCLQALPALAAEQQPWVFDNGQLRVQASARTPQQIAAFYIGRKFPADMVEQLRRQCFITFVIRNHSDHVIWLEQDHWRFEAGGEVVRPLGRSYWKSKWQEMNAPLAAQSTFRWTLLPERLDFRPKEGEGGNVVLPRTNKPIRLVARFRPEGDQPPIEVRFDDLRCARDPAS